MPKDQKNKFSRILESAISGLSEFASVIDDLSKQSTMMLKLLNKSIKELKSVKLQKGVVVVEEQKVAPARPKIGTATKTDAREKAASLLFNMLSTKDGSPGVGISASPSPAASVSAPSGPPKVSAPRSGPPKAGPPSGPPKAGPPSGPPKAPSGPPKAPGKSSLPPPPKLPPVAGKGAPPPGNIKAPTFTKSPIATPPKGPPGMVAPGASPAAAAAGGGSSLGSLRDEMLKELDRLKKIMRGG